MYNIYKVKSGDTLETISSLYEVPVEKLVEINSLNANTIRQDDELIIPDDKKEYFEYYTINKGDTLYDIARRYNINPDLLSTLNGLNNADYIYPNQVILIPKSNFSYYITKSGDTIDSVIKTLGVDRDKFFNDNNVIYLLEGQLLVNSR